MPPATQQFFVAGGTIPPGSPSYIERTSDQELLEALLAGEYAYVLDARQMGKSSLAVRTLTKLKESGVRTGFVDLTAFGGATSSPDQWYAGLLVEVGRALGLRGVAADYLKTHKEFGPARRLMAFLQEQVIPNTTEPVVLLIDEIDAVRSLPFPTDELFAGIRQLHNARAFDPSLNRLTICLLGAALPSDLIKDPRTTPFNVGRRIELRDFTLTELRPFESGFATGNARLIVDRIHHWTAGHPFLAQSLCAEVAANPNTDVDTLVRSRYLYRRSSESDTNLADVANRLLRRGDPEITEEDVATTLSLYVAMRKQGIPNDEANPACARIKMSGIARLHEARLTIRNRIYASVFDRSWVLDSMPGQEIRRQRRAFWVGVARASAVAAGVVGLIGTSAVIAFNERTAALVSEKKANASALEATAESARAIRSEAAMKVAKQQADNHAAEEARLRAAAQKATDQAIKEGKLADQRASEALSAKGAATRSALLAQTNEAEARRLLYDSNMALAGHAASSGSGSQIESLLAGSGSAALRGWEYDHYRAVIHEAVELPDQGRYVLKLAFSPSGRLLVKEDPNILQVWDLSARRLVRQDEPRFHPGALGCDISGPNAVMTGSGGIVHVLSPETLLPMREVRTLDTPVLNPHMADSGSLAMCTVGNQQRTLDLRTGKIALPRRMDWNPMPFTLLPDGDVLEGTFGAIIRWRISDPNRSGIVWYACGKQGTNAWAASVDGSVAAFSDQNGSMQLVAGSDGSRICPPVSQSAPVGVICFSPDGDLVASGSTDGSIYIRRVTDGALLRILQTRRTRLCALAFSEDRKLAYGTETGQIGVFELSTFSSAEGSIRCASTPITHLALSPDGSKLAASAMGIGEEVLDTSTGRTIARSTSTIWASVGSFSPDGSRLALGLFYEGRRRTIKVLDLKTRLEREFPVSQIPIQGIVKFSQDGQRIMITEATAYYVDRDPSSIDVYDAKTGRELFKSKPEAGGVGCLIVSPDGRSLLVGRHEPDSQIIDEKTLKVQHVLSIDPKIDPLKGQGGWGSWFVSSGCFSPDGRWAVLGRSGGRVDVFDAHTGKMLASWLAHTGRVTGVGFTRGSRTLLTVSDDHRLRMWAPNGWRNVGEETMPDELESLAISPKDDSVFIGDTIGTVFVRRIQPAVEAPFTGFPYSYSGPLRSWDAAVDQSKRSGKPMMVFSAAWIDDRYQIQRGFFADPSVREILKRHVVLFDAWPGELITVNKGQDWAEAVYPKLLNTPPGEPAVRVLGDPRVTPAQRYDYRRAAPVALPVESIPDGKFVSDCQALGVRFTPVEANQLRVRIAAASRPMERTDEMIKALADLRRAFQTKFDAGDPAGAMVDANKLIAFNPADQDAYVDRARVEAAMSRWNASVEDFTHCEGLARPRFNGWYPHVNAELLLQGKTDEYRRRLQTVLRNKAEMFYDSMRAWTECVGYGIDPGGSSDPVANAKRIEHAYARNFTEAHSEYLREYFGLVLMRAGRLGEAERTVRAALTDTRFWPDGNVRKEMSRMLLALILAHEGKQVDARKEFDRADSSAHHAADGQLISGCGPATPDHPDFTSTYVIVRRETAALLRR